MIHECQCVHREQDSPGSVGGCGCGSIEDGELWVLTHGTAAMEGGREGRWVGGRKMRERGTEGGIPIIVYTTTVKLNQSDYSNINPI